MALPLIPAYDGLRLPAQAFADNELLHGPQAVATLERMGWAYLGHWILSAGFRADAVRLFHVFTVDQHTLTVLPQSDWHTPV